MCQASGRAVAAFNDASAMTERNSTSMVAGVFLSPLFLDRSAGKRKSMPPKKPPRRRPDRTPPSHRALAPLLLPPMLDLALLQTLLTRKKQAEPVRAKRRRKLLVKPLPFPVTDWASLLQLAEVSAQLPVGECFQDCERLPALREPLQEIAALIGMKELKDVVGQLVVQSLQREHFGVSKSMRHIVLLGPPGVGKSTLARLLAKLLARMGLTRTEEVVEGNRTNMTGEYLGQTDKQTHAVINEAIAKGGVLFIDEAHVLGDRTQRDSFSRSCVSELNTRLEKDGDKFICIVAGYEKEMEEEFFAMNPGLRRRFPWTLRVPVASPGELALILRKMLREEKLALAEETLADEGWFQQHRALFPHSGGSVANLVAKLRVVHSWRVFGQGEKGTFNAEDLKAALKLYREYEQSQHRTKNTQPPPGLYL